MDRAHISWLRRPRSPRSRRKNAASFTSRRNVVERYFTTDRFLWTLEYCMYMYVGYIRDMQATLK